LGLGLGLQFGAAQLAVHTPHVCNLDDFEADAHDVTPTSRVGVGVRVRVRVRVRVIDRGY